MEARTRSHTLSLLHVLSTLLDTAALIHITAKRVVSIQVTASGSSPGCWDSEVAVMHELAQHTVPVIQLKELTALVAQNQQLATIAELQRLGDVPRWICRAALCSCVAINRSQSPRGSTTNVEWIEMSIQESWQQSANRRRVLCLCTWMWRQEQRRQQKDVVFRKKSCCQVELD